MNSLRFHKYQGTGNDFVLIDNRQLQFPSKDTHLIQTICHRRLGIGADGLILLQESSDLDFEMVYYNSDGKEGSMCGNGGRCIVHFAQFLGIVETETKFLATDGGHLGKLEGNMVTIGMNTPSEMQHKREEDYFIDTGSPHYLREIKNDPIEEDLITLAKEIRHNSEYKKEGVNFNLYCEIESGYLKMRTFERGVEGETLSCGTGVTAAAVVYKATKNKAVNSIRVLTKGGELSVNLTNPQQPLLSGEVQRVFEGEYFWANSSTL